MLENKICFITGSTRGIGWSIAQTFARHGAIVIINGRNNELLLERFNELKNISYKEHQAILCDISDLNQVKECYNKIFSKFKKLDVLVNNAGILEDALIGTITQELINKIMSVNVYGAMYNLQYATKLMKRNNSGSVINVTSIIGRVGNSGQTVYGASKAAIIGLTYSAAKELASNKIRVNAIAPGFIDTDMIKNIPNEKYNQIISNIKMGRIGKPEDIANAALFFASDYSDYITGQVLGVDGGMLI
ncbi:MAG: SDR family NAD(P)-dependent oxidoreductase [Candidatus Woesearchaeota archaeon]